MRPQIGLRLMRVSEGRYCQPQYKRMLVGAERQLLREESGRRVVLVESCAGGLRVLMAPKAPAVVRLSGGAWGTGRSRASEGRYCPPQYKRMLLGAERQLLREESGRRVLVESCAGGLRVLMAPKAPAVVRLSGGAWGTGRAGR